MKSTLKYIFLGTMLFSCSNPKEENTAGLEKKSMQANEVSLTSTQMTNSGIVTGSLENREMHISLQVNGVVTVPPENNVSVSAPLGGYLKKTSLVPGMKVNKGSVLAVLEDQQYIQLQQDYLTAKSRLYYLEADFNRQKGLNESKIASDKTMQQIQSDYSSQRILVRSLAEKLRLIGIVPERLNENNISRSISLYAPISGFVVKVNVNTGKYVSPSDVLFELMNPENVCASLTVFENDASRISIGQKILCKVNNNPGVTYAATVELISPSIGENRATEILARFDKYSKELFPGTFVSAEIQVNNAKVPSLPEEAIVKWENRNYVFTEKASGKFSMQPVETGNTNEGYVEIKSPLPAGKIVVRNAYVLLMKMKNSEE